jgi:hypothetical protein
VPTELTEREFASTVHSAGANSRSIQLGFAPDRRELAPALNASSH